MNRMMIALTALVLLSGGFQRAEAGGLLYSNGAVDGTLGAFDITNSLVTNSFTLSSSATVTSVSVGLWVDSGATPTSLDWSIGTSEFSVAHSGTASSLSNTLEYQGNSFGEDVYQTSFNVGSITLGPGTYWLTLSSGVASDSGTVSWDEANNGPSGAYSGSESGVQQIASESFTIYGTAVPEPGGWLLAMMGSAGLIGLDRFRRKATAGGPRKPRDVGRLAG